MGSFYSRFYSLAAVVAAAVSQSKKAVSPVAAAVVGVGLLCSPIESVQGQSSPYYSCPEVTDVVVTTAEASDYELRHRFFISFDIDTTGSGWNDFRYTLYDRGGGYFTYWIRPVDPPPGADDWVLLHLHVVRGPNASVSAWVEDGDGNSYSLDVTFVYGR